MSNVDDGYSVLTCVYCGSEYPQGTPSWDSQVLTDHIRVCEKHPLRQAEAKIRKLRSALIALVGAETQEDLADMRLAIKTTTMHEEDRENMLAGIDALLETM
jgi:hypothetical protein